MIIYTLCWDSQYIYPESFCIENNSNLYEIIKKESGEKSHMIKVWHNSNGRSESCDKSLCAALVFKSSLIFPENIV